MSPRCSAPSKTPLCKISATSFNFWQTDNLTAAYHSAAIEDKFECRHDAQHLQQTSCVKFELCRSIFSELPILQLPVNLQMSKINFNVTTILSTLKNPPVQNFSYVVQFSANCQFGNCLLHNLKLNLSKIFCEKMSTIFKVKNFGFVIFFIEIL